MTKDDIASGIQVTDRTESSNVKWSLPAAEARLKDAFERGGWSEWASTLLGELEAEARTKHEGDKS